MAMQLKTLAISSQTKVHISFLWYAWPDLSLQCRVEASFHPCPISHLGKDVPDLALSLVGIHVALPCQNQGPTIEAELVATRQPYGLFSSQKKMSVSEQWTGRWSTLTPHLTQCSEQYCLISMSAMVNRSCWGHDFPAWWCEMATPETRLLEDEQDPHTATCDEDMAREEGRTGEDGLEAE